MRMRPASADEGKETVSLRSVQYTTRPATEQKSGVSWVLQTEARRLYWNRSLRA